jgi:hypothetical protein
LITSYLLRVDGIVGRVAADEPNIDHGGSVVDLRHQPILVAANIENDPPTPQQAGGPILQLDIRWLLPVAFLAAAYQASSAAFAAL